MTDADVPRCRSCFAVLRFVLMGSGKKMPCNPVPDPTGNVAARKTPKGYVDSHVLRSGGPGALDGYTVFRSHFSQCDMKPRGVPKPPSPSLF
mgnify:FL=1